MKFNQSSHEKFSQPNKINYNNNVPYFQKKGIINQSQSVNSIEISSDGKRNHIILNNDSFMNITKDSISKFQNNNKKEESRSNKLIIYLQI